MNKEQRMRNRATAQRLKDQNRGLLDQFCPWCHAILKFGQAHYYNARYACEGIPEVQELVRRLELSSGVVQDKYMHTPHRLRANPNVELENQLLDVMVTRAVSDHHSAYDLWLEMRLAASYCLDAPIEMPAGSCRFPAEFDDSNYFGAAIEQSTFWREPHEEKEPSCA